MLTAQINLKTIAAVSLAASTDETRYYLKGVFLEVARDGVTYIATDGHVLLASHEALADDAERNTLCGTFIIPIGICRAKRDKRESALATLQGESVTSAALTIAKDDGTATRFKVIDGTFPNWRRVVPGTSSNPFAPLTASTFAQACDNKAPQFNPTLLAVMQKFSLAMGDKGVPYVHYSDAGSPAPITFGPDAGESFGIVMPVRGEAEPWSVPAFVTAKS